MREAISFCRICLAQCGVTVSIDDDGRPVAVRGDKANELTAGFACSKGVDSWAMHTRPDRILRPLKRRGDGTFEEIPLEQATAEIAAGLRRIIDSDGPQALALYSGTASYFSTILTRLLSPFMQAIGSPNRFTPLTIDASSAVVRAARMGVWGAGRQRFDSADVWLMFGINPLVSPRSNGVPPFNPTKRFKAAKARGMQVIVVDPRRTETAQYADLFLQVRPGEDTALAAAMLRIILEEERHDQDFCASHVEGLDRLHDAVAPFTPDLAAALTGVAPEQIRAAARLFAGPGKRGCADPGTGITMSPFSNLADHMVELLNVVCGRMMRAGEKVANPLPLFPRRPFRAEVLRPPRWWEGGHKMRSGNYGMLFTDDGGELPTAALSDEILLDGDGQIKALLSIGGNPASAFPDQTKVVKALRSLELLVALEPFMTTTARLAQYVIPPKLMYERPDLPLLFGQATRVPVPFTQYTPAIVDPPAGAELADEWHFIWDLARRLGKPLTVNGRTLGLETAPTDDELLDIITAGAQVSLDEVRRHPHGKTFAMEQLVEPGRPDCDTRFDVLPDDVADELVRYRTAARERPGFTHQLVVRRMRQSMNSLVSDPEILHPKKRFNPAYMNSVDLATLGVRGGDRVEIRSDAGTLTAVVETDDGVRPGVVSMSHAWGGLPDDAPDAASGAACTSVLVSTARAEPINAMPRMTAIPVVVTKLPAEAPA
jgi:anaerobic selenocysteine-containing dehydrogenase